LPTVDAFAPLWTLALAGSAAVVRLDAGPGGSWTRPAPCSGSPSSRRRSWWGIWTRPSPLTWRRSCGGRSIHGRGDDGPKNSATSWACDTAPRSWTSLASTVSATRGLEELRP
jgi:hypothetical protein